MAGLLFPDRIATCSVANGSFKSGRPWIDDLPPSSTPAPSPRPPQSLHINQGTMAPGQGSLTTPLQLTH